jgi:hypothetical protein
VQGDRRSRGDVQAVEPFGHRDACGRHAPKNRLRQAFALGSQEQRHALGLCNGADIG